jgi:hypothetical protein
MISTEIARDFADVLITEIRSDLDLRLSDDSWSLIKAVLVLEIEDMKLADALDANLLSVFVHRYINQAIRIHLNHKMSLA